MGLGRWVGVDKCVGSKGCRMGKALGWPDERRCVDGLDGLIK